MKEILLFVILAISMNAFAQVSKTVNIPTGSLLSAPSICEKKTVVNISNRGTFNARDYKIKRDKIHLLAEEELSKSTISANITKLYDFDCKYPYSLIYRSNLVNDGTCIYGIISDLFGDNCFLFRIKPDGTEFQELYSFGFYMNDCKISISENKIFGSVNNSSIFKINTDGSNYTQLDISDKMGSDKFIGSWGISGDTLYGTIERIVADGIGSSIFKINTDGSGFSTVYSSDWISGLYISDNILISSRNGKFFRINTDGSGYNDLGIPSANITTKGSVIYGVVYDNTDDEWSIFKVNLDGSGYTILKSISNSLSYPVGTLSINGSILCGMTNKFEFFKVNLDGTDFTKVSTDLKSHEPYYEPTLVGEKFCGLTWEDGNNGTLFHINTANNSYSKVFKFGTSDTGMLPMGSLIESNSFLYGLTYEGGAYGMGTIFRINTDGSGYTKLFEFKGEETGAWPEGQLTLVGNQLFGTTSGGLEQTENGCIFKINLDGSGFTILHKFDNTNGAYPNGSLVLHKGSLYGITRDGGVESHGVVFKINTDGTGFTKISDNTDFDTGENPENGITISDDDVIYGVSTVDYGGVFKVNTDGTDLKKIFEMNHESGDFSYCKPLLVNDELFVTTSEGGTSGVGTIFKIKTDGTGFTVLYNFEGIDEDSESSGFRNNSLTFHNGVLYGTATGDGINDHGYLYQINLDGSGFTKLSDFNGEFGSMPYLCDLIIADNEDIYGMTTFGGKYSGGIIYRYSLGDPSASVEDIAENTFIQVYPNPASSTLFITGLTGNEKIYIFDLNGCLITSKQINGNQININELANGVYILKILNNDNSEMVKFIKQ